MANQSSHENQDNTKNFWSIRGVSDEVKNKALSMAKSQGLNIGVWISNVVNSLSETKRLFPEDDQIPIQKLNALEQKVDLLLADLTMFKQKLDQEESFFANQLFQTMSKKVPPVLSSTVQHSDEVGPTLSSSVQHSRATTNQILYDQIQEALASVSERQTWDVKAKFLNEKQIFRSDNSNWTAYSLKSWLQRQKAKLQAN